MAILICGFFRRSQQV